MMLTTTPSSPPRAPASPPGIGELLSEMLPLVGSVAFYGPPVILLAGPWTLLGLMLMGPFALLLTLVVVLAAVIALLAGVVAALVAAPYLLIHRLTTRRARSRRAAAAEAETAAARPAAAVEPVRVGLARTRQPH